MIRSTPSPPWTPATCLFLYHSLCCHHVVQVTEGLLPSEHLPQRVQKLCDEIGVPCKLHPGGGCSNAAVVAEMLHALRKVQAEVGIQ